MKSVEYMNNPEGQFSDNIQDVLEELRYLDFSLVLREVFPGRSGEDTIYCLWNAPLGILAATSTITDPGGNQSVDFSEMYSNYAPDLRRRDWERHLGSYGHTDTDPSTGDLIWYGATSIYERASLTLANIKERGTFLPKWKFKIRELPLYTYMENELGQSHCLQKAEERASRLPRYVREAILV